MIRAKICRGRLPLPALIVALWAALFMGDHAKSQPAPSAPVQVDAAVTQMEHISVQTAGKGPAVILIPGLSSPRAVWDGAWQELARTHRVHLVQVNGFAGDDPRGNLQPGILKGVIAELHAYIARNKLAGARVAGHSLGGLATLMLARDHPGDVGKAMIVDALPFVGSIFVPGSTPASIKPQAEAMRAQMASLHGKPLPDAYVDGIANFNARKPDARAAVARWTRATDFRVSAQALYEDMMEDVRPQLSRIAAPVTVVVPWSDRTGEQRTLELYTREYAGTPQLTIKAVGDSGHFVMLDQPAAFRALLGEWAGK